MPYDSQYKRQYILRDLREAGLMPTHIPVIARRRNVSRDFVRSLWLHAKQLQAESTRRRSAMNGVVIET